MTHLHCISMQVLVCDPNTSNFVFHRLKIGHIDGGRKMLLTYTSFALRSFILPDGLLEAYFWFKIHYSLVSSMNFQDTQDESLWLHLNKSLYRVSSMMNGKSDAIKQIEVIGQCETLFQLLSFLDFYVMLEGCFFLF